jgi:hypothetical protein
MFDGFQLDRVDVGEVTLRVRYGGAGDPVVLLVSANDDLDIHGDPEAIWRPWVAVELRSRLIHSGHHQAEEAPDEVASALLQFLGTAP